MDVNTRLLREFIVEKFSVEDFLSFLFDYFPQVYNEITPEMRQGTRIQLLLEHCHNYGRFPDLLANLERERPGAFHPKDFSNTPIPKPVSQIEKKTPYQRNPRQIFISHASQDAAIAGQLAGDLKRHGWEIWMAPNSIYPGEKWVEAINRGLAESGVFVLVLTETAVSSRWVRSETNVAIGLEHRNELRFLPLEFGEAAAPPLWEGYQWISFREDYKAGLENLLTLLQPEVMTQLNQLYRQMQQAFGNHDWNL
ncbi:MAG: toll/interleukin-1 receptor domain-containing protein, partial [Anaerolineales bacterium]|nr:toll/interleukin-1 receptor domain-containing protein [Anaerolineales bacterium]